MSDRELLRRNIDLAFEVIQTGIADPQVAGDLTELARDGGLVLADPTDAELSLANERLAEELRAREERVVFAQVNKSATVVRAPS